MHITIQRLLQVNNSIEFHASITNGQEGEGPETRPKGPQNLAVKSSSPRQAHQAVLEVPGPLQCPLPSKGPGL